MNNIANYISESNQSEYDVTPKDFDGCYVIEPKIQTSISQGTPWDKFVIEEHPGCPVGCTAVAAVLVIAHTQYDLFYHGSWFHMKSIINAIKKEQNSRNGITNNAPKRIVIGDIPYQPTYTYEQAVDSMAKILYWIGKDVNMTYTPSSSGAYSSDIYNLLKSLKFEIPSGYAVYNLAKICNYIKDNHIVYLRGNSIKGGHAWVSDGAYFCVDINDSTIVRNAYIHCDWGWGGNSNGYYNGAVFATNVSDFTPTEFFAVKEVSY